MAQVHARDTHAEAIRRLRVWAESEQFSDQLIRAVRTRLDHLHHNWAQFQTEHNLIMPVTNSDQERADCRERYIEIEEAFLTASEIMLQRLNDIDNDAQDDNRSEVSVNSGVSRHSIGSQPPVPNAQQQAMPQIVQIAPNQVGMAGVGQIPWQIRVENTWGEFDGNFMKWPAFHDSFMHSVYRNVDLKPVNKLQTLKAALKGKALKAFGEWMICDNNFEPAWQRLKDLFDDQYKTSKELLNKLTQLKKLESQHGERLQTMSNTVQEVVRQLGAMGYPAEHFDVIFVHLVHEKMDSQTSVAWDKYRTSARPTLNELTKFLDREAKALCNAYEARTETKSTDHKDHKRTKNGSENRGQNKRLKFDWNRNSKNEPKKDKSTCAACSEEHATRTCSKFLALNLAGRREKIQKANRCFNCLRPGHSVKDCRAKACERCENKKHSDALCPENPQNRKVNVSQIKGKPKANRGGKRNQKSNKKSQ